MNKKLEEIWREVLKNGGSADIGEIVVCDWCSEDYTDSDEVGGFLFGSRATCPKCAVRLMPNIVKFNEESHITARAEPNETFRAFSLRMRGGNNTISVERLKTENAKDD